MPGGDPHDPLDYRVILEQVPAIVYIAETGPESAWLYLSEWIEPILGYTAAEWLEHPGWARHLHPDDRERVLQTEDQLVALGLDGACHEEYRLLHKDGHPVWIRDSSKLLMDQDGNMRWHGVLHDISDLKAAEIELERQSAAQAAVAELGEHALERIPIEDLLNEACAAATRVLEVESAMVTQANVDQDALELRVATGWFREPGTRRVGVGPDTQIGATLRTGRPAVVDDWDTETRYRKSQALIDAGVESSVCVRIEGQDAPWGCFGVLSTHKRAYSPRDVSFIQSLANVLADAIDRQVTEDAIEHRSLHDSLTGLPNRTLFNDRLEQAFERLRRRGNGLVAILFVDLDNFKQVNDTLGHQAGDELLISVAQRMREAVRPTDTVARLSGDEFVVLLEEIGSERDAIATAERIAAGFSRPLVLEAGTHFVTASLGIALADSYSSPPELLANADTAMYRAKERGRARYELFDEDMRVRAVARMRLENDLARAIEQGELRLAYQPVVDLSDESIIGVEALLRWDHPLRGAIPPLEFIPVAEESGLIDRIGRWVIEEALREAGRWAEMRPDSAPLRVGLNVSLHQLQNLRFPELLGEYIAAAPSVSAESVLLEFNERVLLDDAEPVRQALRTLHAIGVDLVLDDFGTGQSSIGHLGSVPLGTLKLDRSFVARLGTDTPECRMAHAVIAMARALSLNVVAEGAETVEQVTELRRLGCSAAQGFLFSPPVSAGEITAMIGGSGRLQRTLS